MESNSLEKQKYIRAQKRVKAIKGFYKHLAIFMLVNVGFLVVKSVSDGGWEVFWEWQSHKTFLVWGVILFVHAFKVFGISLAFGKDWEERKVKEIIDKDSLNQL